MGTFASGRIDAEWKGLELIGREHQNERNCGGNRPTSEGARPNLKIA